MQAPTSQQTEDERFIGSAGNEAMSPAEQPPIAETGDISGIEADKQALEQASEGTDIKTADGQIFKTLRALPAESKSPMPTKSQVEARDKEKIVTEIIEEGLSEGLVSVDPTTKQLSGLFVELPPDRQALLKQEGERIARDFDEMFKSGKLDLKEVQMDIKQWLKIIPGVNRPWLEQQATITKDRIANIYKEYIRDINPN